ncbi:protein cholesin isoform X2 [Vulpes vulpes]|uniref:Protein cholesin isoform X2 n=1 Tax=Vulpes vulpes TaxID=9627 RepID=A0ABM5A3T1_VULVU
MASPLRATIPTCFLLGPSRNKTSPIKFLISENRGGRSSIGGWAGDGPPAASANPGGEEGPGEETEEGAEKRGEEATARVRSSPEPTGQAFWGPAGPGLPPWVPDELFSTLLAYLEGLQGRARELTVQKAEALMQKLDEAGGMDPLPQGKTQRIRQQGEKGWIFPRFSPVGSLGSPWSQPAGPAAALTSQHLVSSWQGLREPENGGRRDPLQRLLASQALDQAGQGSRMHHPCAQPTSDLHPCQAVSTWCGDPRKLRLTSWTSRALRSLWGSHARAAMYPPPEPPRPVPPGGPTLGEGAQSSTFVEGFPLASTPSHLAERLLKFVLGQLKHQLVLLASLEKT